MAAAITDLLTQATTSSRPTPTQVTSTRSAAGTTLACNALTGWPTGTAVHFVTYKVNTSGVKTAGSQIDMKGVVSGTNITQIVIKAGTDVGNAIGDIVEASPTAAWANDVVSWGTAHANQDGSLLTSAVQSALGLSSLSGWTPVGFAPATCTALGNRSYSMVFNSQDLTSFLSAGTRLRTTRTVAAPTQCTSLNGTTQYYSKTSPAGMTFTNNWTTSLWIKLSSYQAGGGMVLSRNNGTSGWDVFITAAGQVQMLGRNGGSANFRGVQSYQSLPLNKWVHIAAQVDMTVTTNTPTTSYIMIDGVDVPASYLSGGTNPTALIQAGNLEVGSWFSGALPFAGKVAQAAVYSAKVTQATILASMHQTLAGTETSLISAYSFNGVITDLNTTNANNLTANGSAVATNADSPFGGQAGGTISSTLDYGIIQSATFSTNTTLVVQVPEGCTIPTSGGVTSVVYSANKAPYGMPVQRGKWRVNSQLRTTNATTSNAAYGSFISGGWQLVTPIGEWSVGWSADALSASATQVYFNISSSTSIVGLSNTAGFDLSPFACEIRSSAAANYSTTMRAEQPQTAATALTYIMYTNGATTSVSVVGSVGMAEIYAENAYL